MSENNKISNYYQNSSFAVKMVRYFVTLLFILFLLSCILIFRTDITIENIQLLSKYLSLTEYASHTYEDEFPITASDSSDITMLRNNLAIVGNNNISLYELSGQKLFSYNYSYSSPAFDRDEHNILVYDIQGSELTIFNSFSRVYSQKFPYSVKCADINSSGFAVVSNEKTYRSALLVYNDNYKEVFRWLSADNYITSIALSENGRNVAACTTASLDGSYNSSVKIFSINSTDATHSVSIGDELPVSIGYSSDGSTVYVITDSSIRFYSTSLDELSVYKFNQSKIDRFFENENLLILTERNNLSGNSMSLIGLDKNGNEIFNLNVRDEICDIAIGKNKFFALGEHSIFEFSIQEDGSYAQSGIRGIDEKYTSVVCDTSDNCYICTNSSVTQITFES